MQEAILIGDAHAADQALRSQADIFNAHHLSAQMLADVRGVPFHGFPDVSRGEPPMSFDVQIERYPASIVLTIGRGVSA